ncbi:hypothetical protein AMTRI_Chr05g74380 [Amborella trichopoda]
MQGKMRRQNQYAGSAVNPMVAAQMQHMSAQRMHHSSAMNAYPGRSDAPPLDEEQKFMSSKAEAQWQWDGDDLKGHGSLASQMFKDVTYLAHVCFVEEGATKDPFPRSTSKTMSHFPHEVLQLWKPQLTPLEK